MEEITNEPQPPSDLPVGGVAGRILDHLRKTRPWILFFAVLNTLGALVMAGGGLLSLLSGACLGNGTRSPFNVDSAGSSMVMSTVNGLILLAAAALDLPVIVLLFRYAGSIKRLLASARAEDLEQALRHQRGYWKYTGILTMAGIIVFMVALFAIITVGASYGVP